MAILWEFRSRRVRGAEHESRVSNESTGSSDDRIEGISFSQYV